MRQPWRAQSAAGWASPCLPMRAIGEVLGTALAILSRRRPHEFERAINPNAYNVNPICAIRAVPRIIPLDRVLPAPSRAALPTSRPSSAPPLDVEPLPVHGLATPAPVAAARPPRTLSATSSEVPRGYSNRSGRPVRRSQPPGVMRLRPSATRPAASVGIARNKPAPRADQRLAARIKGTCESQWPARLVSSSVISVGRASCRWDAACRD